MSARAAQGAHQGYLARPHPTPATPDGESPDESADGRHGVWVSFAPEFRRLLAASVGPRTLRSALRLIQMTAAVLWGLPCFFSEGLSRYWPAARRGLSPN
jgi:hypothetical protein